MLLTGIVVAALVVSGAAAPQTNDTDIHTGVLDGARYRVEVPPDWNGTLLLYHHGIYPRDYVPEQIELANRPEAADRLLDEGYALAASLYSKPYGFSARQAVRDQTALLGWFDRTVGTPDQVVTWGASGGALNAVLLSEHLPRRIDGVLAMCGPVAGGQALFTQLLDYGFTVRTLLAPELELAHIGDPEANVAAAHRVLTRALETPQGRARLALAGALGGVPGWQRALQPRPAETAGQIREQTRFVQLVLDELIWGDLRTDLEAQAGGNPTGNTGVDYRRLLPRTSEHRLVREAYREAALDLSADLDALAAAPRIAEDRGAARWLVRHGTPTGHGTMPVATLHPVGDGVAPAHERSYATRVEPARLRQLYVDRGGHCQHTAAEELTALRVVLRRVESGRWPVTAPAVLDAQARRYGPEYHRLYDWLHDEAGAAEPAFTRHHPRPLPRMS